MTRDDERQVRAQEEPIVGGLPDVPGIGAAIRLTPGLGVHLRGLADELLAFSMYNRMVDGFRARTAPTPEAYRERAGEIATHGYSGTPVTPMLPARPL